MLLKFPFNIWGSLVNESQLEHHLIFWYFRIQWSIGTTGIHQVFKNSLGGSFFSCTTWLTLDKFVGCLVAIQNPPIRIWWQTFNHSLPPAMLWSHPLPPQSGNGESRINSCLIICGVTILPWNQVEAFLLDSFSLSIVRNTTWRSCWQLYQVGWWANKTISRRAISVCGFSVKDSDWSFQLHRSLVTKGKQARWELPSISGGRMVRRARAMEVTSHDFPEWVWSRLGPEMNDERERGRRRSCGREQRV